MKIFDCYDGHPCQFDSNYFFAVVFMCDDSISVYEDLFSTHTKALEFLTSLGDLDDSLKSFIFPVSIRKGGV